MSQKFVFYDGPLGRFVAEVFEGRAYLHLTMKEWSLEAMREVRKYAPVVMSRLREMGFERVYAYNKEEGEAMWIRFMALFGFREKGRRNGWILMERDNA